MHISSQMACCASLADGGLEGFECVRILGSHIDKALARATSKPGKGEPFEDPRRIPLHEEAVGEGSWVALVTVGNNEAWAAIPFPGDGGPLLRCGEAGPTTTAQSGNLNFVQYPLRVTVFQHARPSSPRGIAIEHAAKDDRFGIRLHRDLWGVWRRSPGKLGGDVWTNPGLIAIERCRTAETVAQTMGALQGYSAVGRALTGTHAQRALHLRDMPTPGTRDEARRPGAYPHMPTSSGVVQVGVVTDCPVHGGNGDVRG
jgi:hypothetical protein